MNKIHGMCEYFAKIFRVLELSVQFVQWKDEPLMLPALRAKEGEIERDRNGERRGCIPRLFFRFF